VPYDKQAKEYGEIIVIAGSPKRFNNASLLHDPITPTSKSNAFTTLAPCRASDARFNCLQDLCVDDMGSIYVCQSYSFNTGPGCIVKLHLAPGKKEDKAENYIASIVHSFKGEKDFGPLGITYDKRHHNIYFSSYNAKTVGCIQVFSISEQLLLFYAGFLKNQQSSITMLLKEIIFIIASFSIFC
jgi:hypothetical protein